jgi:hypothetical protein
MRCIRLVELIDANRKKTAIEKRLTANRQKVDMETHHCTFIAAVCTLRPASVSIILNGIVALAAVVTISATLFKLWCGHEVAIGSRLQIYPHHVSVQRCQAGCLKLRADMRKVKTCALEVLPVSS